MLLPPYDAVLVVSFGGPERREDVLPFLENVLRGRNVPRARLDEVAGHYYHFDGRSPIAAATRGIIADLQRELEQHGSRLPVYGGNRNWHPFLADTLRQMAGDGIRRALAIVTSAFGSYSSCRQYLEDIARARAEVGAAAPEVDKIRLFYNHPAYLALWRERLAAGLARLPGAALVFTAHSIPTAMAATGPYEAQLAEACALIASGVGAPRWRLAYQSRSGPPQQPWLEPSLDTVLGQLHAEGATGVVLAPLGFLSDHMEVVYDLDVEAAARCRELGLAMERIRTVGDHPGFAPLLRTLIAERLDPTLARLAAGPRPAWPDACPQGCCLPPPRQR